MNLRKYRAVVAMAMAQTLAARAVFVGRVAFYAILLTIYGRIWELVGQRSPLGRFGRADLVWYLAITEWIALSLPAIHLEIEADVRSGNVAYLLSRPISYFWLRFAEGLGTLLVRMLILGLFGFGIAYLLSGGLASGGLLALVCGALTAVVAATLNLIFCAIIGLSAFFTEDTSPLYWVWQKLAFVFGGLMFPLDMYPEAVRTVANATPFPSLLYAPGRIAIGAEPAFLWQTTLVLLGWLVVAVVSAHFAFRRALKTLEINGG
ncbi:MAG TPA: ABC-2 family transporter protein [Polyangiaceae bacterium]